LPPKGFSEIIDYKSVANPKKLRRKMKLDCAPNHDPHHKILSPSGAGQRRTWLLWLALGLASLALAGCAGAPSQFSPESVPAKQIYNLFLVVYGLAAVVFVIVEGALVYAVVRFGRKQGAGLPSQIDGNPRLEVAWTVAPALVLAVVFVLSLQTLRSITTPRTAVAGGPGAPLHLRVVGHQWWWEFDYPDLNIVTATEMHVPVGVDVNLDVESADVVHSFWVPQLGGQLDAVPGHVNHMWFQVSAPGTYRGQCAEFCGAEHAGMQMRVVAESPDQFQAWVKAQQAPAAEAATGDAAAGEQAFVTGACVGCHTITGTKANGQVGPNLTHFASRQIFAGALYDNTADNVAHWLANPQSMKPYNLMPNLHLSSEQIGALVAYLESLK
jgi:cytochrome c oxidase subunit II